MIERVQAGFKWRGKIVDHGFVISVFGRHFLVATGYDPKKVVSDSQKKVKANG